MKQSIEAAVRQYVDTWNLEDPAEINAGFEKCLSENCTYTDKNISTVAGVESFTRLALGSHKQHPGRIFTLTSQPEHFPHHGHYSWRVSFRNEEVRDCMDYFQFDDNNKITAIIGFV